MTAGLQPTAAYTTEEVWLPQSEQIEDWGEDFHALLLGDRLRMVAFQAAIRESVRPGATVLDLGTGTGILALWALQAGASRVYGMDVNEAMLRDATERIQAAGCGDCFHPVPGLSFEVTLPERVDVIVSETLGNLVDNEGCVRILKDASRRFLAENGVLVPSRAESYLVPVAAEEAHSRLCRGQIRGGDELSTGVGNPLRQRIADPFGTYYDAIVGMETYLATPRVIRQYTFGVDDQDDYRLSTVFLVQEDSRFTGFKGYFIATLSETVALDISGDDIAGGTTSDSWKHCYLPVRRPVAVRRGDRIVLTFARSGRGNTFGQTYQWEGHVVRDDEVLDSFVHRSGMHHSGDH